MTLTTTLDLPLLNLPPTDWYKDPGYPAAADKHWVAELYVDDESIYGYADAATQRGIRFIDGNNQDPDFEADYEFAHKDTGAPWTAEEYQNIEFTPLGITLDSYMPWLTPGIPTLTVQDTGLKFNISTKTQ